MRKFCLFTVLWVFVVLSSAVFFPGGASASESKSLKVATDAGWPPMEMKGKDGAVCGYGIDVMDFIAKEQGFTVQYIVVPWDDIFKGLEEGKYDAIMSSVSITDERKAKYGFSNTYFSAGQIIVVPIEMKNKDLKGKTVGALKDSTGLDFIRNEKGAPIKSYDEIDQAFADMKAGKIFGVVCDSPVAASYCVLNDEYKGRFTVMGQPFTKEDYGIAVKKGDKDLLDKINKGIAALKAKGADKKLYNKWFK